MADVARELGLSPGNLYNYVEGKDALFLLALRHALGEAMPSDVILPVAEIDVALTVEWVAQRLDFVSDFPELERILAGAPYRPGEIDVVTGELHDVLSHMRLGVEMIERSVNDLPALGAMFGGVRADLIHRYQRYLEMRRAAGHVRVEDPATTAYLFVEACWWAAGRRHRDPNADTVSSRAARAAVCQLLTTSLEVHPRRKSSTKEDAS
jgi:AcrR family transcriptional regulator